ncbi:heparan sulfate glucosamine 3-O-sulfotransferase 1-like [Glandiceps talaboti]
MKEDYLIEKQLSQAKKKSFLSKKVIAGLLIVVFLSLAVAGKVYNLTKKKECLDENVVEITNLRTVEQNVPNQEALSPTRKALSLSNSQGPGLHRRLPKALIIGVQKSGTGALLKMLNLHPDVKIAQREVHFFDLDENYSRGYEWYRHQMPLSFPNQITIEKTPGYCDSIHTPKRIYALNPGMKILVIVRDPTERAISQYVHTSLNMVKRNIPYGSFEELAIRDGQVNMNFKSVKRSVYIDYMKRWFEVFPSDQIHVVDGGQIVTDPAGELQKVEDFLELRNIITRSNFYYNKTRGFYCMTDGVTRTCLQMSKGRKHPEVDLKVLEQLRNYYRPYNKQFEELIGRQFDWP